MINGFHVAAILYLLYNAMQMAYHAGKGEWTVTFGKREMLTGAIIYTGIASIILLLP